MNALVLAISIVLLSGSLVKGQNDAVPPAARSLNHDCTLFHHNITVEEKTNGFNCKGIISVLSCAGMCQSQLTPHAYENKEDATNHPFISDCNCCRITRPARRPVNVHMTCREGNSVRYSYNITRAATTALRCGCAPCTNI